MVAFLAFILATSVFDIPLLKFPCSAPRGPEYQYIGHMINTKNTRSIQKTDVLKFSLFVCT